GVGDHDGAVAGGFDERRVGLDHLALAVPNVPRLAASGRLLGAHRVAHSGVVASAAGSHLNLRAPDSFPVELFVLDPAAAPSFGIPDPARAVARTKADPAAVGPAEVSVPGRGSRSPSVACGPSGPPR